MVKDIINDPAKFSELVGLIYDSAQNPELWPELLAELDNIIEVEHRTGSSTVVSEQANIDLLRSHFQRALDLNNHLYRLQTEVDAITGILDRLPIGVILVNADMVPVALNNYAKTIIKSSTSLCVEDNRLVTRSQEETKRLSNLVENNATVRLPTGPDQEHSLVLRTSNDEPLSIWVAPSSRAGVQSDEGLAAIFISSSSIRPQVTVSKLSDFYALTEAEARLLNQLVNGCHSLSEAAEVLDVSKHTVRTQMKTILEKTGTHSQLELLKKVLRGPAALFGERQATVEITDLDSLNHAGHREQESTPYQTILLNDHRRLEYADYGDPDGQPVIFLHSILHSRQQLHPFSSYAEENGIRIIAPERPGFGESDLPSSISIKAYADDIRQLADHLKFASFNIIGDASGGAFALACAAGLPGRVRRVAVISCIPSPGHDRTDGLIPFERMLLNMGKSTPVSFHKHFAKIMMKGMQRDPDKYYDRMFKHLPDADKVIVSTQEKRSIFMESIDNAFPGRVEGFVSDYLMRLTPWDFDLKDIECEVQLWHGTANRIVSIESARLLERELPNCRPSYLDHQGHYLFITYWDEIVKSLVSEQSSIHAK